MIHFLVKGGAGFMTACGIKEFRRVSVACVDDLRLLHKVTCPDCLKAAEKLDPPESEETLA